MPPDLLPAHGNSLGGQTVLRDAGGLKYLIADHLGSTVAITNSAGTLIDQQRYMPFGQVRYIAGTPAISSTDYEYTGQRNLGDMGLMDYKARFYSPLLGRFVQPDTVTPGGPQGLNRYSYGLNNPVKYTDPSGHKGCNAIDQDENCKADQFWNWHNNNRYKPSPKIIAFVKDWEKFIPDPYDDLPDDPEKTSCTVGYGFVIHPGKCDGRTSEKEYFGISEDKALDLGGRFTQAIKDTQTYVDIPLTQEEFDALIDFAYNVGTSQFSTSNVVEDINMYRFDVIPSDLDQWRLPLSAQGLPVRRSQEGNIFYYGIYDSTH